MKDTTEIVRRLKAFAADLVQLEQESVAAGISLVDILDIEDAVKELEHLAGRLAQNAPAGFLLQRHLQGHPQEIAQLEKG